MPTIAKDLVCFVREQYKSDGYIPLHAPQFCGAEKKYLSDAIDSTMVSTVGEFVVEFEQRIADFTGAKHAVAVCNGTAALHLSLLVAGVTFGDEVVTQSLTFIATCNAINYCGANPVFVDVEKESLGLSSESLRQFLEDNASIDESGACRNKNTGKIIRACVPVHNLGHPADIESIKEVCEEFHIIVVEDAAEALGSLYKHKHVGAFGQSGVISFNGNKIITTGGGGVILTNAQDVAEKARHLSTTAKTPHRWLYVHDQVGFNYRMPNLNAALGCGQLELLDRYVEKKRTLSAKYAGWFRDKGLQFFVEAPWAQSNYWLNAFFAKSREERDMILEETNAEGVMTRPMWTPMYQQVPYRNAQKTSLPNSEHIEARLVCIPSSPIDLI